MIIEHKEFYPDAKFYNPDEDYLRRLIDSANVTQRGIARIMNVPERTLRDYLNAKKPKSKAPYTLQFSMEVLAGWREVPKEKNQ